MRPQQHVSNNSVLAPPPGATIDEVVVLPITRVLYADGAQSVRSFWKPTPEELAALNAGEPVCFEIFQHTHAPILLGVVGVSMAETHPLEPSNDS